VARRDRAVRPERGRLDPQIADVELLRHESSRFVVRLSRRQRSLKFAST
jgi:hypothetical protein